MIKKQKIDETPFDEKLTLFKFFLSLFGKDEFSSISKELKNDDLLGYDENNSTYFYSAIAHKYIKHGKLSRQKLLEYDENICRHLHHINKKRGGIQLKYFQYLALLFTEIYLDKYFTDKDNFVAELNEFTQARNKEIKELNASNYNADNLNKLCFMCATGSGKTLIMHINILQYMHYFEKGKKLNPSLTQNKIILLTPNEGLSNQHLAEFELSGISADLFNKNYDLNNLVTVIDMHKLEEQGKDKTVAVDSFESNNLVLVDEGHKGLQGNVWYDFRTRLSSDGFAFEYSATFKQALKADKKDSKGLLEEYGKAIIMDYSYKYFYNDGYGKDYRIYNLSENINAEQEQLYLTGCLLSFYQQIKVFNDNRIPFTDFMLEKPLLIFVGHSVNKSSAEITDVEKVLLFINDFTSKPEQTIARINAIMSANSGLVNQQGVELFYNNLDYIKDKFDDDFESIFFDVLKILFNSLKSGRLYLQHMKLVSDEIALKIGQDGDNFGVISVGDTTTLVKNCSAKGIVTENNEFDNNTLFGKINDKNSQINILIGSRKFTEGWNSWRVSTMGLINFGKSEGSQAIQLFGRGVRLRGFKGCLKRSKEVEDITPPKYIHYLEKLTIFGIKADYMKAFKEYLEREDMSPNDNMADIKLPTVSRFNEIKNKDLKVLRIKEGINFKKQGLRQVLDYPTGDFFDYIMKNKVIVDGYAKVQTLVSSHDNNFVSQKEENIFSVSKYLNYNRIFTELQRYKNAKSFYNVSIDINLLKNILDENCWYTLSIPAAELELKTMADVERLTDVAIMLLKGYLEKYFKFHKNKWESHFMEYCNLAETDNNLIKEYIISLNMDDVSIDKFKTFINDLTKLLADEKYIQGYEKSWNGFSAFDFRNHLYAPLISLKVNGVKIEISPVALNESEKVFVDLLQNYFEKNKNDFKDKELYLLRNKSKTGVGFFEAGGFYPDFIMWIIANNKQYINFIEPKGILMLAKQDNNPKIMFHENIKELENRLANGVDNNIILNSFILSITTKAEVKAHYNIKLINELEAKNVLFLEENDECIEKLLTAIEK